MRAIRELGDELIAAVDPNDSVGVLDSFFPDVRFFTEFERFDRHIDKIRRQGRGVHFVSVCSPNYLHDAHCRFGLRADADVVCEKPLVLNPWNLDGLAEMEVTTGRRIYTILQLRLHPTVKELKRQIDATPSKMHDIDLTYITSRGGWYHVSWKGNTKKSGGIATNIGVHFFDMLSYVFGEVRDNILHLAGPERAAGRLQLARANVRWFLSVSQQDLSAAVRGNRTTFRSMTLDGEEIEFSDGFDDLHRESYRAIKAGHGFTLETVRPAIEIVSKIRNTIPTPNAAGQHPQARKYCAA